MGQYFLAVCPDRGEFLRPRDFGCGLKAPEILYSSACQMDAHAIMIADPGIAPRPADLAIRGVTGSWAGYASFYVGDESDGGDASRWPWPVAEEHLYDDMQGNGRNVSKPLVLPIARMHGMYPGEMRFTTRYLDGRTEVSRHVETLMLKPDGDGVSVDMSLYADNRHIGDTIRRAERRIARERLSSYSVDARDGCRRLVANLDRREYIDPRQLAEIPTLVGIMRGQAKVWRADPPLGDGETEPPSTLQMLSRRLFSRGVSEGCDGEWRTDRLLITAERSRRFPTTSDIEGDAAWTDVTQRLAAMTTATVRERQGDGESTGNQPDWARFHRDVEATRFTWRHA